MRRLAHISLAVAVAALVASPALAQQQGRRQGGFQGAGQLGLLMNKDVQKDLKLTTDQVSKIDTAAKKQREAFQGLQGLSREERTQKMQALNKETRETLKSTLKPEQEKRLHQLELQQRGLTALATPANARNPNARPNPLIKELNITADQQQKIQDIQTANREKMREIFQNAGGNRQEAAKKMAELNKSANDKIMGLLTADQKAKWKEMTGEPFKGQLPAAGFGGGARRPGGGGARPPV